jgi:hypothetical protein
VIHQYDSDFGSTYFSVTPMFNSIREFLGKVFARNAKSLPVIGGTQSRLTGVPLRPRLKTYSSDSGYVYQYVFRGQLETEDGAAYLFSVASDRNVWNLVSILLTKKVVTRWEQTGGTVLRGTDRYAVAKLTLFELLDRAKPLEPGPPLSVELDDISRHLTTLGVL